MSRKRVSTEGLIADLFSSLTPSGAAPAEDRGAPSVPSPLDASARFTDGRMLEVPLNQIRLGTHQARRDFNDERIRELAESIRTHGLIEPILVTPHEDGSGYLLVAGERRLRAATLVGRTTIPATVREDLSQVDLLVLSLVENLQREDLSPTERAEGVVGLQKATGESFAQVAKRLGYTKARVSQLVGYRRLPKRIYDALGKKRITEKQAQAILRVEDLGKASQDVLYRACVDHDLRDAEAGRLARSLLDQGDRKPAEVLAEFLAGRQSLTGRGRARRSRLASLTAKLERLEYQLSDVAGQLSHLGPSGNGSAEDMKQARSAVTALKKRVKEVEGALKALGS